MTLLAPRKRRGYRGLSAETLQAQRRQRLLAAGLRLISSRGYAALTIGRLCSVAKVSPRHFYEQFPDREALLRSLFDEMVEGARSEVLAALQDGSGDPLSRALDAVHAFVLHVLSNPRLARLAFIEVVGVSPQMEAHRRRTIDGFVQLIAGAAEQMMAAGQLPQAHYRLAAVALVGATNEMIVDWLGSHRHLDAEQMARAVVALYRTLIQGAMLPPRNRS